MNYIAQLFLSQLCKYGQILARWLQFRRHITNNLIVFFGGRGGGDKLSNKTQLNVIHSYDTIVQLKRQKITTRTPISKYRKNRQIFNSLTEKKKNKLGEKLCQ